MIDGFNLWLDLKGEGMWGQRTVSLKFKDEAGRYRDPVTNRAFTRSRSGTTGYRGVEFTDVFRRAFDAAPRNNQGRPVAATATSGAVNSGDSDDLPL